ncbi:MAG TPA: SET domain-containing protein [Pyrinomonadaceae bacterium]|jgi:SET domain-containing protein|nr:SET domain-containing protein [Pyrinomonadaceae bacterium]
MTLTRDKFVLKRTVTGLGLFTLQSIPSGKRIMEYVGPIVTTEEVNRRNGRYFFEIDENFAIDGSPRTNIARYINHSCRPNAEAFVAGRRVWIWSKKNIEAGEQITINYGKAYFDDYIKPVGCKCEKCARQKK